jgi:hypothetical protein
VKTPIVLSPPDAGGGVHTLRNPSPPVAAAGLEGADVREPLAAADGNYWESDLKVDFARPEYRRDGIVLTFPQPRGAASVKLVVTGMNTSLGLTAFDIIFARPAVENLLIYHHLNDDPEIREPFRQWLAEDGGLTIEILTSEGWRRAGSLPTFGTESPNTMAVQIPLTGCGGDGLKVRLECTRGTWRLDAVGADFSPDEAINAVELRPLRAVTDDGGDITGQIAAADNLYYNSLPGDYLDVEFAALEPLPDGERSYIVRAGGHYYGWHPEAESASISLLTLKRALEKPRLRSRLFLPYWAKAAGEYAASHR